MRLAYYFPTIVLHITPNAHCNSNQHLTMADEMKPTLGIPVPAQLGWSSGLCDCTSDFVNCCITCWCPCITFGQIAEIVDRGSSSCGMSGALYALIGVIIGCPCCYSCFYRTKLRQQYSLPESPCGDCLVHCFCEACALCQEYRELKNRGFDVPLGWQGNLERQNQGFQMAPAPAPAPVMGEMQR